MNTIREILRMRPSLLTPNQSVRIHLLHNHSVFIENIGSGPQGYPAIAVGSYLPEDSRLQHVPEIHFEIKSARDIAIELMPFYLRDDTAGLILRAALFDGITEIDTAIVRRIQNFAWAWDMELDARGILVAYIAGAAEERLARTRIHIH